MSPHLKIPESNGSNDKLPGIYETWNIVSFVKLPKAGVKRETFNMTKNILRFLLCTMIFLNIRIMNLIVYDVLNLNE